MILETSGQPAPTEEEVQFAAQRNEPNGKKTMLAWYWKISSCWGERSCSEYLLPERSLGTYTRS